MARLNDFLDNEDIPNTIKDKFGKCFFCSKEINEGGIWSGTSDIGVCVNCCDHSIDLLIDTLEDADTEYRKLNSEERLEKLINITKERFFKKEKHNRGLKASESMKKLGLKYYAEVGIIDDFGLSMTPEELKGKLFDPNINYMGMCGFDVEDVDICLEKVKEIVYSKSDEEPHTIRFFSIPNFNNFSFDIGCVAKIDNNGCTYIFAKDKKFIENYETAYNINSTI